MRKAMRVLNLFPTPGSLIGAWQKTKSTIQASIVGRTAGLSVLRVDALRLSLYRLFQ